MTAAETEGPPRAMAVAELIAELTKVEPDAPVLTAPQIMICHSGGGMTSWTFHTIGWSAPTRMAGQ